MPEIVTQEIELNENQLQTILDLIDDGMIVKRPKIVQTYTESGGTHLYIDAKHHKYRSFHIAKNGRETLCERSV